jgi:predicted CopG family antitoxin
MKGKKGKPVKKTTIVLKEPVYTELKSMKLIEEESFDSVISRILLENKQLKEQFKVDITIKGEVDGHI